MAAGVSALKGWTSRLLADGVDFTPPAGMQGGVRVYERQRPLRRPRDVVRDFMQPRLTPAIVDVDVGATDRLVTQSGLHAATITVTLRGASPSSFTQLDFGFIIGDDFYDMVVVWTFSSDQASEFRKLAREVVYTYQLSYGETFAQRYAYTAPPKWTGLPRPLGTAWIPPDVPHDDASITVAPARPTRRSPADLARDLATFASLSDMTPLDTLQSESIGSEHGLSGQLLTSTFRRKDAEPLWRHDALLIDARYAYLLRLDVGASNERRAGHLKTFRRMIESVEPVPSRTAQEVDVFVLWNE